jgi:hypothetical protein
MGRSTAREMEANYSSRSNTHSAQAFCKSERLSKP